MPVHRASLLTVVSCSITRSLSNICSRSCNAISLSSSAAYFFQERRGRTAEGSWAHWCFARDAENSNKKQKWKTCFLPPVDMEQLWHIFLHRKKTVWRRTTDRIVTITRSLQRRGFDKTLSIFLFQETKKHVNRMVCFTTNHLVSSICISPRL